MAYFAKIVGTNNIVTEVCSVGNDILMKDGVEDEQQGVEFLHNLYKNKYTYIQTSYNTSGGQHKLGKTPLRKNYAGVGYTYDKDRDAFIPPKAYPSWVLDEETCRWNAPTPLPDDALFVTLEKDEELGESGKKYIWDEDTVSWKEIE